MCTRCLSQLQTYLFINDVTSRLRFDFHHIKVDLKKSEVVQHLLNIGNNIIKIYIIESFYQTERSRALVSSRRRLQASADLRRPRLLLPLLSAAASGCSRTPRVVSSAPGSAAGRPSGRAAPPEHTL